MTRLEEVRPALDGCTNALDEAIRTARLVLYVPKLAYGYSTRSVRLAVGAKITLDTVAELLGLSTEEVLTLSSVREPNMRLRTRLWVMQGHGALELGPDGMLRESDLGVLWRHSQRRGAPPHEAYASLREIV